ncbi:multidrug effflux MFS transporter [Dryocola sp. BD613]|uniref:multidrug effflux MFS transporter n=1 Tax=Dryocola sp. BD613 TaxID=3133272 RepID=UPI003F4F62B5
MTQTRHKYIAPILGTIGALGPLAIDMYLPAMPQIAAELHVGAGEVQFSLMSFFSGLMAGQLFYGPVSDRTGRKPMIYTGLIIFIIASLGCALAESAGQLVAWRFAQGIGGSIGMVIGLAIVRDLFKGREAAKLVALIMIVTGVAPIIAPLLGTSILAAADWPALFIVLAVYGLVCLVLVATLLPETRREAFRLTSNPLTALHQYGRLLRSRNYISYASVQALIQAGFFAYLAGSSFIFISLYGMSPSSFSLIFAVNAIGMVGGSQLSPRMLRWFSPGTIIRSALIVNIIIAAALLWLEKEGQLTLPMMAAGLFLLIFAMAVVMPVNGMMALDAYDEMSGTAAALMGAMQFGAGSLASFIVGVMADGTAKPMLMSITLCGCVACLIAWFAFPDRRAKS